MGVWSIRRKPQGRLEGVHKRPQLLLANGCIEAANTPAGKL